MSFDAYPARDTEQDVRHHLVQLLGTGASAPTKVIGKGITVSYTAAGRYLLTWASNPGEFLGFTWGLQATTQADVKGHTVTAGAYPATASTFTLEIDLWDSAFAAEDLEALEWLFLDIAFKLTGP